VIVDSKSFLWRSIGTPAASEQPLNTAALPDADFGDLGDIALYRTQVSLSRSATHLMISGLSVTSLWLLLTKLLGVDVTVHDGAMVTRPLMKEWKPPSITYTEGGDAKWRADRKASAEAGDRS